MALFQKGFQNYLQDEAYADVHITINNDKTYKGHRIILSYHSEYFLEQFKIKEQELFAQYANPKPTCGNNDEQKSEKIAEQPVNIKKPILVGLIDLELQLDDVMSKHFPIALKYMYGDDIDLTPELAIPLYAVAAKLKIQSLKEKVDSYLNSTITRDTALIVLRQAIELTLTDVLDRCVYVIARNFQQLIDEQKLDVNWLPYHIFLAFLKHGSLCVTTEFTIYKVIRDYLLLEDRYKQFTESQKYDLFETVRLPYLAFNELETVVKERLVPEELLAEAVMFRLSMYENPNRVSKSEELPTRLTERAQMGRVFEYSSDFDENGVIHYLGTNGRKNEWKNPALTGAVKVTASSIEKGKEIYIVDKTSKEVWTKEIPSSWFAIDLRKGKSLLPTYYTLRHGASSKMDCLRSWVLQGSDDGSTWEVLSRHQNDQSFNSGFATKTFKIDTTNINKPYRMFRVLQTGHNSGMNNFLAISGIEFYGDLYESVDKKRPVTIQLGPSSAIPSTISSVTNASTVPPAVTVIASSVKK
eukprot:TRINITY_DN933_c0_g1_i1.p1 TRINITY_DN933_c0_g1~~TRINITY_DN933_c0_g1_i1.p1  ORF type:complete len:527 (+),score=102.64 TRINITY_DN933_c0_g1_i1:1405-2985(+)